MTPAHIADRLDQRFRLLTGGSRTALPRHQTLRAVVDWSWDLLDDTERTLLRGLSAFTGGATLEAAEQVCAIPPVAAGDMLDLLTALADKSLLTVRHTADGPRYVLLETIREYGRDRLADAGDTETLRRRHAAYFLAFAERAQQHLFSAEQLDWLRMLSADADNLHMAIRGAVAAGDTDTAVGLVGAVGWYWWLRSMKKEGGELAALVLRDAPTAARALAIAAPRTGDRAAADPGVAAPAIAGPGAVGLVAAERLRLERLAVAYGAAGMLTADSPRVAGGLAWLREAEELARRLRPEPGWAARADTAGTAAGGEPLPHVLLALAGIMRTMIESLARTLPEHLDEAVADPHPWVSGLGLMLRGQMSLNHGRPAEKAEADFRAAVSTFERVGERWGLALAVSGLAQTEEWRGDLASAAAHYGRAADLAGELGTTEDETQCRLQLARVLWHMGGDERERSRAEVARALRDADRLGWPEVTSYAAFVAGDLARLDGDYTIARAHLELATRVAAQPGVPRQIAAVALTGLGYLTAAEGDLEAARSLHDRAVAAALPTGDSPVIAGTLTGLANVMLLAGDAGPAATLLGVAEGVRGTRDRSDDDRKRVDSAVRAELDPADYGAAFQRGQGVTLATLEAALTGILTTSA